MTPEERAKKIARVVATLLNVDPEDPTEWVWTRHGNAVISEIAAEIRAAVEEDRLKRVQYIAYDDEKEGEPFVPYGIAKAKADAYEDAAKIADENSNAAKSFNAGCDCAEAIRARAKELAK